MPPAKRQDWQSQLGRQLLLLNLAISWYLLFAGIWNVKHRQLGLWQCLHTAQASAHLLQHDVAAPCRKKNTSAARISSAQLHGTPSTCGRAAGLTVGAGATPGSCELGNSLASNLRPQASKNHMVVAASQAQTYLLRSHPQTTLTANAVLQRAPRFTPRCAELHRACSELQTAKPCKADCSRPSKYPFDRASRAFRRSLRARKPIVCRVRQEWIAHSADCGSVQLQAFAQGTGQLQQRAAVPCDNFPLTRCFWKVQNMLIRLTVARRKPQPVMSCSAASIGAARCR